MRDHILYNRFTSQRGFQHSAGDGGWLVGWMAMKGSPFNGNQGLAVFVCLELVGRPAVEAHKIYLF